MLNFCVFCRKYTPFHRIFEFCVYISVTQISISMKFITTLALSLFLSLASVAQISQKEKKALLDLYSHTQGDSWNIPWNLEDAPTTWKGVTIINNKVIALSLANNNLQGNLPETLGNLKNLKVLNLHKNKIEGSIPETLTDIKGLKVLNLSFNKLNGTLPSNLTQLFALEYLDVFFNNLTGELPEDIGNLTKLRRLSLYSNDFTGQLPASIVALENIKDVQISSNRFYGELPEGIIALPSLKRLSLFDNNFSGDLPENLNSKNLEELSYHGNSFNEITTAIAGG